MSDLLIKERKLLVGSLKKLLLCTGHGPCQVGRQQSVRWTAVCAKESMPDGVGVMLGNGLPSQAEIEIEIVCHIILFLAGRLAPTRHRLAATSTLVLGIS